MNQPIPWDQALDLVLRMNELDKVEEDGVTRIAKLSTLQAMEKQLYDIESARQKANEARQNAINAEMKAKALRDKMEPMVTEYLSINYATVTEMLPHIKSIMSRLDTRLDTRVDHEISDDGKTASLKGTKEDSFELRGTITPDARTNQIILTDTQTVINKAKQILQKLDRVTPQVLIEAKIIEASTSFSRSLGVTWGAIGGIQAGDSNAGIGPQRGFDVLGGTYGYNAAINLPSLDNTTGVLGFNFTKIAGSPLVINATIDAMESNGLGKVIASPRVLTLDNKQAFIEQGLEVGYLVPSTVVGQPSTVDFKEVTLSLTVTPHVTQDNRISLNIEIKKDDILGYYEGIPRSSTKKATTELLIDDGDTLVIGGITKTAENDGTKGIPLLSKIPILGWLFKNQSTDRTDEELLIFMTPRILQLEQR